jgi:ribose transport system permease protein
MSSIDYRPDARARLDAALEVVRRNRVVKEVLRTAPVLILLVGLLVWISIRNPVFTEPPVFLGFVRFAVPLMIVAAGQLFVIVSGEFDLSVGSLITAVVVIAATTGDNDPSRTWWLIILLLGLGIAVGLVNGFVTTILGVPSFITTLGMLLVLSGGALYWTDGSPRGYIADNFRNLGRGNWQDVPYFRIFPYAVALWLVVGALATWLLHATNFGRQLFAAGGNPRAAALSGVNVARVRTTAFVLSAVSAVVAGIVLGGIVGVSPNAGAGYEFQAITAVVLGGAVLGGGRGSMVGAMAGALALQALFTLLNLLGLADAYRQAFQGAIIIAAVAFSAYRLRQRS